MAAIQSAVAQRAGTSSLQPGSALAGPPATTVLGTDLGHAAVGSTFNVSTSGTTVTFNNGSTTATGTVTVGTDSGGNQIVVIDADSFGVRLTLRAAAGAPLAGVLSTLNGASLATAAAPSTVGDQYGQQIAAMGVESSTAQTQSTNQLVLVNQLKRQRDDNSSVSLDEEAANLIQYQHAYQAAARVITVVDEMLNTLINSTGTVGR
jgi:flagellar hook-associated protein 1